MRMPLLDRAFYLLDGPSSPQDFTLIFNLHDLPDVDRLHAGARSAMNRFPISACSVVRGAWAWRENEHFRLAVVEGASGAAIEKFIDEPFELRCEPPVKQLLVLGGSSTRLATRFHHAAADGLSAALWLGHQLNVAFGLESMHLERGALDVPSLRQSETSVRRSQFSYRGASDALRTSGSLRSGSRRWSTVCFNACELQRGCRRLRGFTYHDLLATCALEVLSRWNNTESNIGLWVPVNVRRQARAGFGNGTSRIRVYANYDRDAPFIQ